MRTMFENYFMNNQVVMQHVGNEDAPAEMLKRNSYALLNVSPRFFQDPGAEKERNDRQDRKRKKGRQ